MVISCLYASLTGKGLMILKNNSAKQLAYALHISVLVCLLLS